MFLQLNRLSGEQLNEFRLPDNFDHTELRKIAHDALMDHFDSNDKKFWPKEEYGFFGSKAVPEEVAFVNDLGNEILRYGLLDLIKDADRELAGNSNT